MDALDLRKHCSNWDGSSDGFAAIVANALDTLGVYQHDLAREFQVANSTVSRWANGVACPHPRVQKLIVASIRKRADRVNHGARPAHPV